ncbi:MAG: hypothetical protein HFE67_07330 [Erysipelotrichaceae bacterium]|nr:hypothetical protein [Erysipelotrichaceae bacterium]
MRKSKLSHLLNQGILAVMGVLFWVLACTREFESSIKVLMAIIGLVLILMGVFRVWLVQRLFHVLGEDEVDKQ